MAKKVYLLAGAFIVILAAVVGLFRNYQKITVPPETPEIPKTPETPTVDISSLESEADAELDSLLNDLTDMEEFETDSSLENLDTSLSGLTQ